MLSDSKNIFWYALFAVNGKAAKISDYFEAAHIEYFYPVHYRERRINNSERKKYIIQPLLGNLVFVKSSQEFLEPHLQEIRQRFGISSNLYYRDLGTRKIIVVPENSMRHFITVASCIQERIIYLSSAETDLSKGKRVRIIDGVFAGIEGVFMRIKGKKRVIVSLPELFSVATASIPTEFILLLE